MSDSDPTNATATLKDTYDLVDKTRKEVNDRIDGLGSKLDEFVTSNEHRLTLLETHQAAQSQQLVDFGSRLDEHGRTISAIKDKQREDEAASAALSTARNRRVTTRQWVLGFMIGAAGTGAMIASILR